MSMKNPRTLAGIKPATFRFVAQHLNHVLTLCQLVKIVASRLQVVPPSSGSDRWNRRKLFGFGLVNPEQKATHELATP